MNLSDRSLGWLRHLHRRAQTADPADLVDSCYAMGFMAHTTPAWTEPYVAVLDQLIARHPARSSVDPESAGHAGQEGDLGPLMVLLGVRSMVDASAGDRADRRGRQHGTTWTHTEIAEQLAEKWFGAPVAGVRDAAGVEPHQLVAAGLGLKLHDNRHGTDFHRRTYQPWWEHARTNHHGLDADTAMVAFHAAPQHPEDARRLFETVFASADLDQGSGLDVLSDRTLGAGLILAREWVLTELEQRLMQVVQAAFEPRWNTDTGEFTWSAGLDGFDRTGQFSPDRLNPFFAAAEASGPGMWQRLSAAPLESCPQVVGIDFPDMALSRAEWVGGNLHLGLAPRAEDATRSTSFRVVGAEPRMWDVHGVENARIESTMSGLNVRVPMVKTEMALIRSSY